MVLEQALLCAAEHKTGHGIMLTPSAAQVATMVNMVRRKDWPLLVDGAGTFRALADSVNLHMARICLLIARGNTGVEMSMYHARILLVAALGFLENIAPTLRETGPTASGNMGSDLRVLAGTARTASALQSLDLMWSCRTGTNGANRGTGTPASTLMSSEELGRLVSVTALFAADCTSELSDPSKDVLGTMSIPLTASLLGLRPSSTPGPAPRAISAAWPDALAAAGEPSFLEEIEVRRPGTAIAWVSSWPKLLWYLGASNPALSAFLLSLLLELGRQAANPGSFYEQLFLKAFPLLMPFLVGQRGCGGTESLPPPLALLSSGTTGAQGLAAMLLQHLPKLNEPFVASLTRLVCRWSDVGTAGDGTNDTELAPARLSPECCELVLEAVLQGQQTGCGNLLTLRLRAALTVLAAAPHTRPLSAVRALCAQQTALQLADWIAGWLMSDFTLAAASLNVAKLGCDDRRRLAFQTLAWPLCKQLCRAGHTFAPRALCFLFFCAARLPDPSSIGPAGSLEWGMFLSDVFNTFMARKGGGGSTLLCSCQSMDDERAMAEAVALLPLCDASRAGGLPWRAALGNHEFCVSEIPARLARLFMAAWMRSVPGGGWPAAYGLLVKLCMKELRSSCDPDLAVPAGRCPSVLLLAEAIMFRNERALVSGDWGALPSEVAASLSSDPFLLTCTAQAVREELHGRCAAGVEAVDVPLQQRRDWQALQAVVQLL